MPEHVIARPSVLHAWYLARTIDLKWGERFCKFTPFTQVSKKLKSKRSLDCRCITYGSLPQYYRSSTTPPPFSDCYTFENLTFPPSFIDQCHIPVVSDAGEKQLSVFKYDL